MIEKLIVGLIGAITGFLGALLNSWLQSRTKLDESTRTERWTVYKRLWLLTQRVPKWPRDATLTYGGLLKLSEQCRDWYFTEGGYHLSRPSQKAYAKMQDAITQAHKNKPHEQAVDQSDYDAVQHQCSALRTELTWDLHSRQRGAFSFLGI